MCHVRCTKCVEERTGYITLFNIMCWISARSSTDNSEDNWLSCHPVWNSRINTRASDLFSTRTKTQFNHIKRCVFQTTTTTSENCFEFRIKVIDVYQKTVLRITNDKYWRLFSWKSTINRCFIYPFSVFFVPFWLPHIFLPRYGFCYKYWKNEIIWKNKVIVLCSKLFNWKVTWILNEIHLFYVG